MLAESHFLKTTEAAVVADVEVENVNKLIDNHILPDELFVRNGGRRVLPGGCVAINFYVHSANILDAHTRRSAITRFLDRLRALEVHKMNMREFRRADWTLHERFVTIEFWDVLKDTVDRFEQLEAARAMVVVDEEILAGTAVLKGTRIPVYTVAAMVSAGVYMAEILEDFPGLDEQKIELAAVYAKANPPRGRPTSRLRLPAGATLSARRSSKSERPNEAAH